MKNILALKNGILIVVVLLLSSVIISCLSNENVKKTDIDILNEFTSKNGAQFEKFTIDASLGDTLITSKGTTLIIKPNIFTTKDGAAIIGNVDIFFKEILNASDMLLDNKPTITENGEILLSFGEFKMLAVQNNIPLILNPRIVNRINGFLAIKLPVGFNLGEIPMWNSATGDTIYEIKRNGLDYNAIEVTVSDSYLVNKGITWKQNMLFGNSNVSQDTAHFLIDALGEWRNCDVLYQNSGTKTTVLCYFSSRFNKNAGTNYMGLEASSVFFKPKGVNSLIKPYNNILNPIAGKDGFYSYINSVPIGLQAKFIAFSIIDGKYYAETKEITIANDAGKSFMGITFNPVEVSEAQLLNMIQDLKNY